MSANLGGRPAKDRLLALHELLGVVQLSRANLYVRIGRGDFPPPIKLGRSARWKLSAVESWMAGLEAKS
jgi:prophage regulatory protein